ncbi:serpentine type 7TM GPCR chemoreceptor srd domain-containing protein [Ditylenchus destructor]|uniref:Serpentine type 7TM GPCR chemoreceptor srd domain-containing protein n=1 Tax=Ditylenchus destructor TaxID=166010 RepID=A0AAD4R2A6_9BILA|nr:serpentine type 7TM GPCR chemoreceptor srd domain-containing protein [Ditylenchus destructor]
MSHKIAKQAIYVVRRGWNLLIPNGPLRTISHPWCYVLQASWFYMIYFSIITNCVPFIYRYLIICRMKTLSAFHYFLMLAGCGLVVAIYMILHTWSTYPHEEYLQEQNYSIVIELLGSDLDPSEFKIGLMMKAHSSKWALACAYISAFEAITYVIIVVCGIKIKNFVKQSAYQTRQNARAQEAHRQLALVMILQSVLPIVELSSTIMCNIVSNLADSLADSSGNIYMSVFLLIPFHWVPLLNPVVTIWVIKPYRNFFIRCGNKRIRPTSTFGATSHTATGPGGAASSALAIG